MASKRKASAGPRTRGGHTRHTDHNEHGVIFRDAEQRHRYNALEKREISNTRYMDSAAMQTLGIDSDVNYLVDKLGWNYFMNTKWKTYEVPTLEFLSSIKVKFFTREEDPGEVSFRLFNQDYTLTLAQFNSIYQLPTEGDRTSTYLNQFRRENVWTRLTNHVYMDAARNKATFLRNPAIRYMHRILSNTLYGRGDSDGVVRDSELFIFWVLSRNDIRINTGAFLAKHMAKQGSQEKGIIVIGGLITPIALALGHNLDGLKEGSGSDRIDLEACKRMKMITKVGELYHLRFHNEVYTHPLPDRRRTNLKVEANWSFNTDGLEQRNPTLAEWQAEQDMDDFFEEEDMETDAHISPPREPDTNIPHNSTFERGESSSAVQGDWNACYAGIQELLQGQRHIQEQINRMETRQEDMWAQQRRMQAQQNYMNEVISRLNDWHIEHDDWSPFNPPPN